MHKPRVIGVISDTHGLLRPEVVSAFKGVSLILHAGDIGSAEVLEGLRAIAPIVAVRGNNDRDAWARKVPDTELVRAGRAAIYMLHDLKELKLRPPREKAHVIVSGHSHRPSIDDRDGILFLNPGSAGPRRFNLPISIARLTVEGTSAHAEILKLL